MTFDTTNLPTSQQLEEELKRTRYRKRYRRVLFSTIYTLITVAAIAVLVATLLLPVLQIYGSSMTPTLQDGDIIFSVKTEKMEQGDIIAFYYNNKILVKRVIALPGDYINIDAEGNVYVNGEILDEPYVTDKRLGDCDLEFPFKVPGTGYFVLGDQRSNSVDSRNSAIGAVSRDDIIGKVFLRVWPFSKIGLVY